MEIWKGKFQHDLADYGHEREVEFELHVEFKDGNFSGIATDPEFALLSDKPIKVKGFIEGDHASFVMVYPIRYGEDENGVSFVNELEKGHEVVHDGYFNPDVEKWTGDWEILHEENKLEEELYEQFFVCGTWELDLPFDSYSSIQII